MKIRFRFIFLYLFLLIMAQRECYAQQDSIVFIGYLVAKDSSDVAKFDKRHLSVSNIRFNIYYREKLANLYSFFTSTQDFSSDIDGCFEIKLPKIIVNSNSYFHFLSGYFKDCYFDFQNQTNADFLLVKLRSSLKRVTGEWIRCGIHSNRGLRINHGINRFYSEKDIERRGGIDIILNDAH